jgi:tetratricopeptide (TPR) repeat protein
MKHHVILFCLSGILLGSCRQAAIENRPIHPRVQQLLLRAEAALARYAFAEALALADSAAHYDPEEPAIAFLQGRLYAEMAQFPKAESAYQEVLRRNPRFKGAWHNLANLKARQHQFREAIRLYYNELKHHPGAASWQAIGRAYRELGQVDSAAYAYHQALTLDSSYVPAYIGMAQLLDNEGRFAEALLYAVKAQQRSPTNPETNYLLGELLMKNGQFAEALRYLQQAANLWPWHAPTHYSLGQALLRLGQRAAGEAALQRAEQLRLLNAQLQMMEEAVRTTPGNPYAFAALGSVLRRLGRYEEAQRAYTIALFLSPHNPEILNNVAALHLVQGDTLAAMATYQQVLRIDSTFVDAWLNLGILHALRGEREAARHAWQQVLRYDPDNPAAHRYLARLARP